MAVFKHHQNILENEKYWKTTKCSKVLSFKPMLQVKNKNTFEQSLQLMNIKIKRHIIAKI